MTQTSSSSAFVQTLHDSGLLTEAQRTKLRDGLLKKFVQPKDLADELLRLGWLTPYQLKQLAQGRGRDLVLGQYLLLDVIGEGGMGFVYKAEHRLMNRTVALKVIRKECLKNPAAIQRFYQEIRAAAQLSHPNVVIAHDAAQVGDTHFLVMEYVPSTDLQKLVKERGPLPVWQACSYIGQAAQGLQHAHERHLVHRDIKPSNLLVTPPPPPLGKEQGDVGLVKILDMGLARIMKEAQEASSAEGLTQTGAVMGTPDYIAPEQARESHQADIRSDIYSLGCSLYFLLAGRPPFPGGEVMGKLIKHQLEEPVPIEQLRPKLVPAVAKVVRTMMAKRPEERYQTPAEVAEALAPFVQATGKETIKQGGFYALKRPEGSQALTTTPSEMLTKDLPSTQEWSMPTTAAGRAGSTALAKAVGWALRSRWLWIATAACLLLGAGIGWHAWSPSSKQPGAEVGSHESDSAKPPGGWPKSPKKKLDPETRKQVEQVAALLSWPKAGPPGNVPAAVFALNLAQTKQQVGEEKPPPVVRPGQLCCLKGHLQGVTSVALSPDGSRALSSSMDNSVRLWDVAAGKVLSSNVGETDDLVWSVAFSPDGRTILTGGGGKLVNDKPVKGYDNSVRLCDAGSGQLLRTFKGKSAGAGRASSHEDSVRGVAFAPDGRFAVSGGYDKTVRLWDVAKGSMVRSSSGQSDWVHCVAFSPLGNQVLSGGRDYLVRLWDADTLHESKILKGHSALVTGVAFSADGRRAVSASWDKTVRVWNVQDGKEIFCYKGHAGKVWCLAVAPARDWALSGGTDKIVRLWDLTTGREISRFEGHEGPITSVAFSADGRRAVSGSDDASVRVWTLPAGEKPKTK